MPEVQNKEPTIRTTTELEAASDLLWFKLASRRFNIPNTLKAMKEIAQKSLQDPNYRRAIQRYLDNNPLVVPDLPLY